MHFFAALSTLSAFALLSTSVAAIPSATFDTFNVTTCDSGVGIHHYQSVTDGACEPLPDAKSIKVYWTRDRTNCRVNTFSGQGCSGDLTSYRFEADNAPCRPVTGKVSYNVTC